MRTERDNCIIRRSSSARRAPSRLRGDGGAIMAEAALLTPFFVMLLFGTLEFGGAYRDYLTSSYATATAARQSAVQGNTALADWYILNSLKNAAGAMPLSQINYVVVYKATAASTGPPSGCLTAGSAANNCNRFNATDLSNANMGTGVSPPANWFTNTPDAGNWPASGRSVLLSGPPDYVGVYVNVTHPWITGLFGSNITLTSNTVAQIEPEKLSS
jgi:Flp pilus assembly protein TadG